ncbi:MAG: cbb3-type cytochrome oxidase subunit 3 [Kofleriaceae bacterium]
MIRMSELVSKLTPSDYAQLALVLFFLVFVSIAIRHGGKRRREEHDACARLPLVDDAERGGGVR